MPVRQAAPALLFAIFIGSSSAQPTNPDPTVQALLNEVRQLRLTLERSAVVAPRIQVTLQRIQLQQEQVSRVSHQLEDVRDRMTQSAADTSRMTAELKQVEARLAQEFDPTRRKKLEEELRTEKAHLEALRERQSMEDALQRGRESELSGRLRTEQAKLDELNDRLNTLERLLEPPQPRP